MSRRARFRPRVLGPARLALLCGAAIAAAPSPARAQVPPGLMPPGAVGPAAPVLLGEGTVAAFPLLPPEVQVVRFRAPEGVRVEILGPNPEPIPVGDSHTYGLRVGVAYRLRISELPNRPDVTLYPVLEVVGHLHRPADIDPTRFPIRVNFAELDLDEAADRGRLVTQIVYLEDPDQAIPLNLPKDDIPVVTLNPAEEPLRVSAALGRPMVIIRLGGRVPTPEEWSGADGMGLARVACPFSGPGGGRCTLPCGPARGTPPPPGRPWLPRDEYLCDGGDRAEALHFEGGGSLRGIDPRDALIQFQADNRPRVLPTNLVCLYAPRFAAVRTSIGPNETLHIESPRGAELIESQVTQVARQGTKRMVQNQAPAASRHRARPSGMVGRVLPEGYMELRVLQGFTSDKHIAGNVLVQGPEIEAARQKPEGTRESAGPIALKTAEGAIVTGIAQGPGQAVMAWKPTELAGVEVPPNRPGMVVIKRTSASVAEPGDEVTFTIQYRNMGNVPISSVSVVDSLMPRIEYLKGSALGPAGTVFSASENEVGSDELRWDLRDPVAPGGEGYVSFRALIR